MSKKNTNYVDKVGVTEGDDRPVISGVFRLYDTVGLPLAHVLAELNERGIVVCWPTFFTDAEKAGWKLKTAESRVFEAIVDAYGKAYFEGWKTKYDAWRESLGKNDQET